MTATRMRFVATGLALALLGGCASAPGRERPPAAAPRPGAATTNIPAGDPVLGRTAANLMALFGQPALDIREGAARKLQFAGPACVLDAYLYPSQGRGEPVASHVDARLPDGRDTDRAACIAGLRRR